MHQAGKRMLVQDALRYDNNDYYHCDHYYYYYYKHRAGNAPSPAPWVKWLCGHHRAGNAPSPPLGFRIVPEPLLSNIAYLKISKLLPKADTLFHRCWLVH